MVKILIVDDEQDIVELLSYNLEKEKFFIVKAYDGEAALGLVRSEKPDLMILDLMLPKMNGLDVCKAIRRNPETANLPIIMLTAKDAEIDKVVGLELGADDYVTKPYSSRELIARIKAVLRRGIPDNDSFADLDVVSVGPIKLDTARHQATINGALVGLPLKEFELLEFLMRNAGRVLTRSQLIDRVWGGDYFGDTKTLDVHIKRLRSKIEADPANPVLIQTIRGLGYKLEN